MEQTISEILEMIELLDDLADSGEIVQALCTEVK